MAEKRTEQLTDGATDLGPRGRRRRETRTCPWCKSPTGVHTPFVRIRGGGIEMYCTSECLTAAATEIEVVDLDDAPELQPVHSGRAAHGMALLVAVGVGVANLSVWPPDDAGAIALTTLVPTRARVEPAVPGPPPVYGPSWPPEDDAMLRVLADDTWVHPLPGPARRMPARDSRVFGARRDGSRPPECLSGHCGVDLGGEVWGEAVLAVHAGVVDHVERNPNQPRGGMYVRLAHRDGTVFTQYFHLAAIPRRIRPGAEVSAGDVIGLVGDTGVDSSGPHLHFTLAVLPPDAERERYIDPEAMLALWPLATRAPGGSTHVVEVGASPGVPLGPSRHHRRARPTRSRPVATEPPAEPVPGPPPAGVPSPGADDGAPSGEP